MSKKNLILGGVLIILVAIAFASGPIKQWSKNLQKPKNFLSKVDVNAINKIEIKSANDSVVLEKIVSGDASSTAVKWRIFGTKDFYIKNNNDFISTLNNLKDSNLEVISENKDNKRDFQTDLDSGTLVKLMNGDEIMSEFIVGKMASDYTNSYISQEDIDNTFIVKSDINSAFARSDWYDKTIFSNNKENIDKIRFQFPAQEFTVEKIDGVWGGTLPYKFRVNQEKIVKILDIMSSLEAADVPAQSFNGTGLEKNLMIIQATGKGVESTLMIGEAKKDDSGKETDLFYAKKGSSDNIYLIAKTQRDDLNKRIWDLR